MEKYESTVMELSTDYEARMRDVFELCDVNKRGLISIHDLVNLAREHFVGGDWAANQEAISRIIKVLDAEENGNINFQEFCEGVKKIIELQGSSVTSSSEFQNITVEEFSSSPPLSHRENDLCSCEACLPSASSTSLSCNEHSYSTSDDLGNDEVMPTETLLTRVNPAALLTPCGATVRRSLRRAQPRASSDDDVDSGFGGKIAENVELDSCRPALIAENDATITTTFEYYSDDDEARRLTDSSLPPHLRRALTAPRERASAGRPPRRPRNGSRMSTPSDGPTVSPLFRGRLSTSSSCTTSRRSSISDGLYNDIDGNFVDLNDKVRKLETQLQNFSDSQQERNEKHRRMKEESSILIERVYQLEEMIREMDSRSQQQLTEERKKYRELLSRSDKEKSQEMEILSRSFQHIESEYALLKQENPILKSESEKLKRENARLEHQISQLQQEVSEFSDERIAWKQHAHDEAARMSQERRVNMELVDELSKELIQLRAYQADSVNRTPRNMEEMPRGVRKELESNIEHLKSENARLRELYEDVQAQIINNDRYSGFTSNDSNTPSLAVELETAPRDEVIIALQKERDANKKLREYVEQLTLRILDKNPSILEICSRTERSSGKS